MKLRDFFETTKKKNSKQQAFDVFLNGKKIDTIFYSASAKEDTASVKKALIDHDGYDPAIVVKKRR